MIEYFFWYIFIGLVIATFFVRENGAEGFLEFVWLKMIFVLFYPLFFLLIIWVLVAEALKK